MGRKLTLWDLSKKKKLTLWEQVHHANMHTHQHDIAEVKDNAHMGK